MIMITVFLSLGEEAGPSDKVQRVRNEVDRVKDIMVANVETIMERGERLELLVDKTENLSQHSVSFRRAGDYHLWAFNNYVERFFVLFFCTQLSLVDKRIK